MSFRIGSMGIPLDAIRSLRTAESAVAKWSERLASGLRINSAAEDGAGLAVSRSRLLGAPIEATSAVESRIRDADYALESALLTRNQILQESAIAVLGRANANMSLVLKLLGT